MKPKFDSKVLFSDTDSQLYRINTIDVYKDMRQKFYCFQYFDLSNYLPQQPLFFEVNEYIVLKFKNEFSSHSHV